MPEGSLSEITETRIRSIFFDAMIEGWANPDAHKGTIDALPGSICFRFEKDGFVVIDCYYSNPGSTVSSGHTLIAYDRTPVWAMHYGGFYEKETIPFLKDTLLKTYESRQFVGGRGTPFRSTGIGGLTYVNKVEKLSTFSYFSGKESISGADGILLGVHQYFGRSLIDLKK